MVKFNPLLVNQQNFRILANLPKIIQDSGEIGEFELGNLKINIIDLTTFEKELIICE